jgi:hypothetical protein
MEKYTNIPIMLYRKKENGSTIFFFSGLPIMEVLAQMPKIYQITDLKLMASTYQAEYIYNDDLECKQTIADLVHFFTLNSRYSIDDMDAVLENNIKISIHDDTEITFQFPKEYHCTGLLNKLLTNLEYNSSIVLSILVEYENQYLVIEKPDKLLKKYSDFNEYWKDNE